MAFGHCTESDKHHELTTSTGTMSYMYNDIMALCHDVVQAVSVHDIVMVQYKFHAQATIMYGAVYSVHGIVHDIVSYSISLKFN